MADPFVPNVLEWIFLVTLLFAATVVVGLNVLTSTAMHFMVFFHDMCGHPNKAWTYRKFFHPIAMQTALAVSFLLSAGATYVYADDTLRQNAALGLPAPEGAAPGPDDDIFEWTWILYFVGYGLQMVIAFGFYYGHFFRASAFLAFLVFGCMAALSPLYWLYLLEAGLLQMFAGIVYLYVWAWHVYWATLHADLHTLYHGRFNPVQTFYAKVKYDEVTVEKQRVTATTTTAGPYHAPMGADGQAHRHYAAHAHPSQAPGLRQGIPMTQAAAAAQGLVQRPLPVSQAQGAVAYSTRPARGV